MSGDACSDSEGVGVRDVGWGDVSERICKLNGGVGMMGVLGGALNIADRSIGVGWGGWKNSCHCFILWTLPPLLAYIICFDDPLFANVSFEELCKSCKVQNKR